MPFVTSSFLLLVVRPGAPSSVLAPTSDGLQPANHEEEWEVLGELPD